MPRRHPWILVALVVLFSVAAEDAAAEERVEKTLALERALAPGQAVGIENLLGTVILKGGHDERKMRLEAVVVAEAETREEASALAETVSLKTRERNGRPWIHVAYPVDRHAAFRLPRAEGQGIARWLAPLFKKSSVGAVYDDRAVQIGHNRGAVALAVHLTVNVPHDVDTAVRQFLGSVQSTLVRGRLDLQNVEGNIVATRTYGSLQARTGGGNVSVLTAHGEGVSVQTGAGGIELVDVKTERVALDTDSGSIETRDLRAADLSVRAGSGTVELVDVEASRLEVATGSADVDLSPRLQRIQEAAIRSVSGDVTLRIGEIAPFDLHVESGEVKSRGLDLASAEAAGGVARLRRGTGGAELRVATDTGEVILRTR